MRALVQSIRDLATEYSAEFGLSRADLVHELILGFGVLSMVWGLNTLAAAAFGR